MLTKTVLSVVVAVVTMLGCLLLGGLLMMVDFPITVFVGAFLKTYSLDIGILAGIWYFFTR